MPYSTPSLLERLQELRLSADDFDYIDQGLEYLPEKGATGELMGELLEGILKDKNSPSPSREEFLARKEREREAKKRKNRERDQDLLVLRAKLIQLRRILLEDANVRAAQIETASSPSASS